MNRTELLDHFERRERRPNLPFVLGDKVEVTEGLYAGRYGVIELLAYAEGPIQYLVDFCDGTDEYFPANSLKLLEPRPNQTQGS